MEEPVKFKFGWLTGIIIGIIVIGLTITIIIIANQETKKEEIENSYVMSLYVSSKNLDIKKSIDLEYEIYSKEDQELISKGEIKKNAYTEIKNLSKNKNYTIYCGGEGYYYEKIEKQFTEEEKDENLSRIECGVRKIGTIDPRIRSRISEGVSTIEFDVATKFTYKRLGFCVSWTSGIININSLYDEVEIPERLKLDVDKCFQTEETLIDESKDFMMRVKSEKLTEDDIVQIYFFDEDLHFSQREKDYVYFSEYEGVNLGNELDHTIRVQIE